MRSERYVPDVYFGRPGALIKLPWPRSGMERPYNRQTFDFLTGSGAHQVSSLSVGSRSYALKWNALHVENFGKLSQYWIGANGPGPWVLIDPSAPNLLPANIAAGTGLLASAAGLTAGGAGHGVPRSNGVTTFIRRTGGWRSIRWHFDVAAAASPTLTIDPMYRSWWGHPVAPSEFYCFSSWLRADGVVDSSITAAIKVEWKDVNGVIIGSAISSAATAIGTGWTRLSISGQAPSNAAYAKLFWEATGATITTGGSLYIDEPLFEQDSVLNDWAPGTGIRPVEIIDLPDATTFATRMREGIVLQLRELAA